MWTLQRWRLKQQNPTEVFISLNVYDYRLVGFYACYSLRTFALPSSATILVFKVGGVCKQAEYIVSVFYVWRQTFGMHVQGVWQPWLVLLIFWSTPGAVEIKRAQKINNHYHMMSADLKCRTSVAISQLFKTFSRNILKWSELLLNLF